MVKAQLCCPQLIHTTLVRSLIKPKRTAYVWFANEVHFPNRKLDGRGQGTLQTGSEGTKKPYQGGDWRPSFCGLIFSCRLGHQRHRNARKRRCTEEHDPKFRELFNSHKSKIKRESESWQGTKAKTLLQANKTKHNWQFLCNDTNTQFFQTKKTDCLLVHNLVQARKCTAKQWNVNFSSVLAEICLQKRKIPQMVFHGPNNNVRSKPQKIRSGFQRGDNQKCTSFFSWHKMLGGDADCHDCKKSSPSHRDIEGEKNEVCITRRLHSYDGCFFKERLMRWGQSTSFFPAHLATGDNDNDYFLFQWIWDAGGCMVDKQPCIKHAGEVNWCW